ncbi:ribosomal protein S18-alanine N-acetyltransferase [Vibrio sonorensis]|uniref:ribosomal protein S18-alanine N-acetyltransferase n=1 Tax=Vibrio sonorensis TaxID=1004316 RepID=UPI0008DA543C|nr:ribosomal protein S18-alanine N-acetyltransferase [Vibrio sonorensis]
MNLTITNTLEAHLTSIVEIENAAHSHPWSRHLLSQLDSRGACHRVLLLDEQVIGYFYAQNIVGEVTLLNIAVSPSYQGSGYGHKLMEAFLAMCQQADAESAWLEVRESNRRAIALYESCGFNQIDVRVNYYPTENGKENAVIMTCSYFE